MNKAKSSHHITLGGIDTRGKPSSWKEAAKAGVASPWKTRTAIVIAGRRNIQGDQQDPSQDQYRLFGKHSPGLKGG